MIGAQPLDRRDRLGRRAAALQPILQPQGQEAEAHAHRAALDHERPVLADLAGGRASGLHGSGHVTRQREHDRGLVDLSASRSTAAIAATDGWAVVGSRSARSSRS